MDTVKPLTNSRSKADWFFGILLLAASLAGLIILWPLLFSVLTVQELVDDFDTYSERSVRVSGRVVSSRPAELTGLEGELSDDVKMVESEEGLPSQDQLASTGPDVLFIFTPSSLEMI